LDGHTTNPLHTSAPTVVFDATASDEDNASSEVEDAVSEAAVLAACSVMVEDATTLELDKAVAARSDADAVEAIDEDATSEEADERVGSAEVTVGWIEKEESVVEATEAEDKEAEEDEGSTSA
jgi:hypothetical protein